MNDLNGYYGAVIEEDFEAPEEVFDEDDESITESKSRVQKYVYY